MQSALWLCCKAEDVINIPSYETKNVHVFYGNLGNFELNDTIEHSLIRNATYVKINLAIYSVDRYGPDFFVYWTPVNRGSYEITVICLSFTPFVG